MSECPQFVLRLLLCSKINIYIISRRLLARSQQPQLLLLLELFAAGIAAEIASLCSAGAGLGWPGGRKERERSRTEVRHSHSAITLPTNTLKGVYISSMGAKCTNFCII